MSRISWDYERGVRAGYVDKVVRYWVMYNWPLNEWEESDWTATDATTGDEFTGSEPECIRWCEERAARGENILPFPR